MPAQLLTAAPRFQGRPSLGIPASPETFPDEVRTCAKEPEGATRLVGDGQSPFVVGRDAGSAGLKRGASPAKKQAHQQSEEWTNMATLHREHTTGCFRRLALSGRVVNRFHRHADLRCEPNEPYPTALARSAQNAKNMGLSPRARAPKVRQGRLFQCQCPDRGPSLPGGVSATHTTPSWRHRCRGGVRFLAGKFGKG